ncbi:MAG TPA: phosphate ABC transporter substrate-binding protein PstS [Candidatus Limnocylindria bacterium]|nr:phosphate ABC transporter substrate-binding protein PstS [Candidatus Limnocylindria bacterium]
MKTRRLLVGLLAISALTAACGGAEVPAPTAAATGSGAADPCGVPVKAKCPTEAQTLTGAGATFPGPIYTKWVDEYNKLTGVQINYQAVGSGGGIKAFTDRTADFGASDVALTDAQIAAVSGGLYMVPTVMGAVVPTYNIPGVTATLKFTPDALAGIFLGAITTWNDPKIASENPGVNLPSTAITTVHRSDGSGTTGVFTDYLSKVSPEWKSKVGSATSVNWPGGVGSSGNAGVAGTVKQTAGSIGYVELIYALQNKLGYGVVKNAAGKYVEASLDSTSKAADGFTMPDLGKLTGEQSKLSITNATNPDAWPISTFTFLLVPKDSSDKAKITAILRFAWWGTHEGQTFTKDLGYAPLPSGVVKTAEDVLRSVTSGGSRVLR